MGNASRSITGGGSSAKANGGNAPSVQLEEEGGSGSAVGNLRAVSGVIGFNNGSAVYNGVARVGSGRALAPGNEGVPVEVIVPVNRGRRLLAQVKNKCCPPLSMFIESAIWWPSAASSSQQRAAFQFHSL